MNQIFGMDAEPLPEGTIPLEGVAIMKCMEESGEIVLWARSTSGLSSWDRVGLYQTALHNELHGTWEPDDEGDE